MTDLHVIGFGSLNLDEFWEVSSAFLAEHELTPGHEYVKDVDWFRSVYGILNRYYHRAAADPGGSAANATAALRKMGFRTGFYGATGRLDIAALRPHELGEPEDLRVAALDIPAGRCFAFLDKDDPGRDRTLVILPNANDSAGSGFLDPAYFERTEWLHLTSFVSRNPLKAQIALVESLSPRVRVSFDPGVVYTSQGLAPLEPIIRRADVFFAGGEEIHMLTGCSSIDEAAEKILRLGSKIVVVKQGAQGIAGFSSDGKRHQHAIPPREIRDRTGAGDVAAAGFLAGMIHSLPLESCLRLAAAAASRSIEGYGRTTYPDREFLDAFIRRR